MFHLISFSNNALAAAVSLMIFYSIVLGCSIGVLINFFRRKPKKPWEPADYVISYEWDRTNN
jgi:hypothetical protein